MNEAPALYVQAQGEVRVLGARLFPTHVCYRPNERQCHVGECESRCPGNTSWHIAHTIMNNVIDHESRVGM